MRLDLATKRTKSDFPSSVHIGGGLWGIFAVPIFRRTVGAEADGAFGDDVFYSIVYRIALGESWRVKRTKPSALALTFALSGPFERAVHRGGGDGLDGRLRRSSLLPPETAEASQRFQRGRIAR